MESTSLFPRPKGLGREPLSSLMLTGGEHLLESGFVSSGYFLRCEAKNLCVPDPGPRACRGEYLLGWLNHAGQHILQKGIRQSKLAMAQREKCLYLLRHICERSRDAGLKLGCRFRVITLPKFVLTGRNQEGLLGTEATFFDSGQNFLP
jgi:hypothetical protein